MPEISTLRNKHKLHHVRKRLYSFIYILLFCFSLCWQNEWVGNLLITYVSCFLCVFLLCCVLSVCVFLFIFYFANVHGYIGALHSVCLSVCCCIAKSIVWLQFKFIADLLAESNHHYHLNQVRLLFCSPSSISYGDFGTKFLFAVRLGTMRERFRCVVFVSGND